MLTAEELRQIRRLHVQAGRRVDALLAGEYRSAFKGAGMEFDEVRPYVPGDDVRRIDWNVTARTGTPFIKSYAEERELSIELVVDTSRAPRSRTLDKSAPEKLTSSALAPVISAPTSLLQRRSEPRMAPRSI